MVVNQMKKLSRALMQKSSSVGVSEVWMEGNEIVELGAGRGGRV